MDLSKFEASIGRKRKKRVEHNMSTLFLQLIQVLMSRIVAQSISILSYDSCVFEFSLTERKLIHGSICLVSHALFLEGPYAFFRPYHLTLTALIRNFFQRVFPRNCARDLFSHKYDYRPNWTTRSSVTN